MLVKPVFKRSFSKADVTSLLVVCVVADFGYIYYVLCLAVSFQGAGLSFSAIAFCGGDGVLVLENSFVVGLNCV